jgi:multidrug transporter EmrE-like cation transporter
MPIFPNPTVRMKSTLIALGLAGVISIVEATALYNIRLGGLENTIRASLLFGLGVVPMLSKTLKYEGIGMVNFFWNFFSTILGFLIGVYFFNERLHYLQLIGVVLSLAGIGLIILAPKH